MADNFNVIVAAGVSVTIASKNTSGVVQVPYHIITDTSLNPVLTDNTNELRVSVYGKGSAAGDTAIVSFDTVGHAGYVFVTNGTQTMPTMDVAARKGFVLVTDGTNSLPTADVAARKLFAAITDGTNTNTVKAASTLALVTDTSLVTQSLLTDGVALFKSASLANLQAHTEQNSLLTSQAGETVATDSIATGTATPDAALASAGASTIWTVKWITITLSATLDQVPLLFKLIQDAGGTPVTLWQGSLAALAKTTASISFKCNIPQTVAAKTLDLSVITGTIVSTNYIQVSFGATKSV